MNVTTLVDAFSSLNIQACRSTPISTLPTDILWRIFLMNADMNDDEPIPTDWDKSKAIRAFNHTWKSSQVCREWRDLVMNASSLWGRVIDLDILWSVHSDWRKEVFARTGDAPLSIRGGINPRNTRSLYVDPDALTFFDLIIDKQWTRIRVLDIWVHQNLTAIFAPRILTAVRKPAPMLEIFKVLGYSSLLSQPDNFFFEDAPRLYAFKASGVPVNLNSSWLQQLRELGLSFTRPRPQILGILTLTPLLETLTLDGFLPYEDQMPIGIGPSQRQQSISLPRLRVINMPIIDDSILEPITPAPRCSLSFSSNAFIRTDPWAEKSILSRYFRNCFEDFSQATHFHLGLSKNYFAISTGRDPTFNPVSSISTVCADAEKTTPHIAEFFIPFIDPLSNCNLSSVKTLRLSINMNDLPPIDMASRRLFFLFSSIETLVTNADVLQFLLEIPKNDTHIFPSLRIVKITNVPFLTPEPILLFLWWRKDLGVPLEILDFTQCSSLTSKQLKYFDQMAGLKVRWGTDTAVTE
ncbi:hypothetical protein GALMADRAFT_136220 [Galerina marginata CBS 339.88]|uniref:Uncharacterized protein n=1 Tax=Galerina marginata (strain CBS 339.88) TaxID=685588 RepID=A0A067TD88_GALM3|nr:hypothetical protein GALMADRAFT_136220 [Galerina marginata CBS 339.88]